MRKIIDAFREKHNLESIDKNLKIQIRTIADKLFAEIQDGKCSQPYRIMPYIKKNQQ